MQPANPDYERAVRESFARQTFLVTIGAALSRVAPGEVDIELPFRGDLLQQAGALHGGVIATIADTACGYAALTLMPSPSEVMSVEFKINLLVPARGNVIARARVLRAGRTLTVCRAEVESESGLIATVLGTFIRR